METGEGHELLEDETCEGILIISRASAIRISSEMVPELQGCTLFHRKPKTLRSEPAEIGWGRVFCLRRD